MRERGRERENESYVAFPAKISAAATVFGSRLMATEERKTYQNINKVQKVFKFVPLIESEYQNANTVRTKRKLCSS